MFKIVLVMPDGHTINMPGDKDLRLFEACDRAEIYKKRNPDRGFRVLNAENGDVEYEV